MEDTLKNLQKFCLKYGRRKKNKNIEMMSKVWIEHNIGKCLKKLAEKAEMLKVETARIKLK